MSCRTGRSRLQLGATLVELVIVLPLLLFMALAVMQAAMVFYTKSNLNYATFEAARAGSVNNARADAIQAALRKALIAYYGGGRDLAELAYAAARLAQDVGSRTVRVEILSPTVQSFADYNSPQLQDRLKTDLPVIPNSGIDELTCPRDVPGCASDPSSNASGQSLLDANLLKLRITYGIPPSRQMPLVGRFYTWALDRMGAGSDDPFVQSLISANRIPVISHAVLRMQSDAIRNPWMVDRSRTGSGAM